MATFYPAFEPQRCFASPEAAELQRAAAREEKRTRRLALAPTRNDRDPQLFDRVFPAAERRWGERRRVKLAVRDARTKAFVDPGERKMIEKLGFDVDATARARHSMARHALGQVMGAALASAEDDEAERAVKREVARRRRRAKERKEAKRAKERRARAKRREEHRKAKRREAPRARPEPVDRPHRAHGQAKHRALAQIDAQIDAYLGGQHRRLMA